MAHIHERIDFTAEVFVVFENKVLLRLHDKYGLWLSVGGHIELDEDPNEAAVREVKEEVGLEIELWSGNRLFNTVDTNKQLIPPIAMNRHHVNQEHEHISMIFFARAKKPDVRIQYEGDRSNQWKWVPKDEIDELDLRPDTRFFALEALKKLR